MSDSPQNAWFHTRQGERIGPLTFAELRVKALEGELDPRLDLVWTEGMTEWQAAGEIADLFGRRSSTAGHESLAPPAAPYAPPKEESVAEKMHRIGAWPGARRRSYLAMTIIFPVVWNFVFSSTAGFLTVLLGPHIMGVVGIVAVLLPLGVGVQFGLARLQNLGMSRWWYLVNLLPVLITAAGLRYYEAVGGWLPASLAGVTLIPFFWLGYRCFACPAGYAFHKKIDGVGIALAIVYGVLMLVTIAAIGVVAAVLLGTLDNPELQARMQELLSAARDQMK